LDFPEYTCHLPRDHSRGAIVAAAGAQTDDDTNGFAAVKIRLCRDVLDVSKRQKQ